MKNTKNNKQQEKYIPKTTAYLYMAGTFVAGFFLATFFMSGQDAQVQKQVLGAGGGMAQNMNANSQLLEHIADEEIKMTQNPSDGNGWGNLGNLYFDTKQFDKAITAYEKALALIPNNYNYMTDLGTAYRGNKQFDKAIESYDKVLLSDPKHINARFNRGIVLLFDLNKKQEAINTWQILIKQDPSFKTPDGRLLSDYIKTLQ